MASPRLYIDTPLTADCDIELSREHAHYLFNVMRLGTGDSVRVFNGRDGEWAATVTESGKKRGLMRASEQTRPQIQNPDIELIFAPIKKARTDFIVEKACELGCRRVRPVFTRYTNSERLNLSRLAAHMIEAAEQCDGLIVPDLAEPKKLSEILSVWTSRVLIFCDESRTAPEILSALAKLSPGTPVSVLIGPEGGFSPEEVKQLQAVDGVLPVSLGPRILRADTAAVAALASIQAAIGDWRA